MKYFLNGIQNGGYNGLMYLAMLFLKSTPPENLYMESAMISLRLLVSEIW